MARQCFFLVGVLDVLLLSAPVMAYRRRSLAQSIEDSLDDPVFVRMSTGKSSVWIDELEDRCGHREYDVSVFVDTHVHVVAVPTDGNDIERHSVSPCPRMIFHDAGEARGKEAIILKDNFDLPSDRLEGSWPTFSLSGIVKAFDDVDEEDTSAHNYDLVKNNCGTFAVAMASNLLIKVDKQVVEYTARKLSESEFATWVRDSTNYSSFVRQFNLLGEEADDGDLMNELVNMYVTEHSRRLAERAEAIDWIREQLSKGGENYPADQNNENRLIQKSVKSEKKSEEIHESRKKNGYDVDIKGISHARGLRKKCDGEVCCSMGVPKDGGAFVFWAEFVAKKPGTVSFDISCGGELPVYDMMSEFKSFKEFTRIRIGEDSTGEKPSLTFEGEWSGKAEKFEMGQGMLCPGDKPISLEITSDTATLESVSIKADTNCMGTITSIKADKPNGQLLQDVSDANGDKKLLTWVFDGNPDGAYLEVLCEDLVCEN